MSATLDAEPVADYLSEQPDRTLELAHNPASQSKIENQNSKIAIPCPILISEGQSFPVQVKYLTHHDERPITEQAADTVERIISEGEAGDILVFMPGMAEINATIAALHALRTGERLALIPLHGDLPPEQQDLAFLPNPLRKVVVATNVAETSITIDGIRHVIDSGLARVARYDAERGISTLFLEPISRASADQRKGRAGRTAPGTCHRLWTESGHLNRSERNTPEIQRSDLAEVVLLLHSLGIKHAADFDWLDKPDRQAVVRAEQLLLTLGALTAQNNSENAGATYPSGPSIKNQKSKIKNDLTPIGRQMLRLPMHPRYSRILVEAARYNCLPAAALCAALVSGRDMLRRLGRDDKDIKEACEPFEASQESDFYTLMRAYQFAKNKGFNVETCQRYGIHAQTARQVEQTFEQVLGVAESLMRKGGGDEGQPSSTQPDPLPRCLMTGFIDQLCIRHDQGSLECDLTEGRHGSLMRESVVQNAPMFVAASIREVTGRSSENLTLLGLATAVKREWIEQTFPDQLSMTIEHLYDRTHKRVAAVKLVRFRDLVIHHEHQREVDPKASGRALAEAYQKGYFELPLLNHEVKQFIARVNVVNTVMPELEFPPFDEAAILQSLSRAFEGLTLTKEAQAMPLRDFFLQHVGKERQAWLDELVPVTIPGPDGRKLKLLYPEHARDEDGEPNSPELQLKIHECFSVKEHPHICEGRLPVKLWLCTPDGKRLEPTFNWPAFKASSYPKLKPSLQKKFPGVPWI